ncbi:hypothetical protein UK23_13225 [Lentzea aerocolonigenes]|uniref:HEAT repeat domain-containing protein n=1 Tax=Lentzea aerocolonigenes TaxID=68170 RepID=A0A0F0H1T9_LENAE|nr:hypothetical protein UK23_13225 [Lentzea aerocolonigenes]
MEQLVLRAKEGTLSAAEVDAVAARLTSEPLDEDTYSLLYVIARTRATRHRRIVESFLDCSEDPMLARLAVQTLCTFWGEADRYRDVLDRFIAGVEWDEDGDVRDVALSALEAR